MSTLTRTFSNVKWTSLSNVTKQGIQFGSSILMARLLAPADFGLLGMAVVFMSFASLFKDLGTSAAVICRDNVNSRFLSTVFWTNILLGIVVMLTGLLVAPVVGYFFDEPRIVSIIRALSIASFVSSTAMLLQALAERDLKFRLLAIIDISSSIIGILIGLVLAFSGYGVWSLVYQMIVTVISNAILLWAVTSWRPDFTFAPRELHSITRFSLNLTASAIFNYVERNMDNILIGKFLGAQSLGYYSIAYRLMIYPVSMIASIVGRVVLPVAAQFSNDNKRLAGNFIRISGAISLVTFPLMLGACASADVIVVWILGEKWMNAIPVFVILAPIGLIQSISSNAGIIYQIKGRTDLLLRWTLASGSIIIAAFYIGIGWGIIGVATAYAITELLLTYPWLYFSYRLINLNVKDVISVLTKPLICSLIMVIVILMLKYVFVESLSRGTLSIILALVGVVTYGLSCLRFNRTQVQNLWNAIFAVQSK